MNANTLCLKLAVATVAMFAIFSAQTPAASVILSNTLGSQYEIEHSQIGLNGSFSSGIFVPGRTPGSTAYHSDGGAGLSFPKEIIPSPQGSIEFWGKMDTDTDQVAVGGQSGYWFMIGDGAASYVLGFNANDGAGGGGLCAWAGTSTACTGGFSGAWTYTSALQGGNIQDWHKYQLVWDVNGLAGIGDGSHKAAIFVDNTLNSNYWFGAGGFAPLTSGQFDMPGLTLRAGLGMTIQDIRVMDTPVTEPTTFTLLSLGLAIFALGRYPRRV